jgi:hypothetical protein
MALYKLKDDGYATFKKIVSGGKWVGRVCRCADGSYLAFIGPTKIKARTEKEAFDTVVAKHCGFADVEDLRDNNRAVRAVNKARKAQTQHAINEMISGNFAPLDQLFGLPKKGE